MRHEIVHPSDPHAYTLARMGEVAKRASRVWSIRELAARIVTRAGPRDYTGQLKQIYDWMTKRWRYVMEPEEFIHGTPESLIRYVFGSKYNAPNADPTKVDLERMPLKEHGWGDCDDVSTATAALILAIGMRAMFRVARSRAGAHVSVVAITPKKRLISVDPVGYPEHKFGWKLQAPEVFFWDIESAGIRR